LKVLGELYHIYYNNRDLRLLLDLLATSSGIAPAIAIMTLFDKVKIILILNNFSDVFWTPILEMSEF
jgi:hypothetical protein